MIGNKIKYKIYDVPNSITREGLVVDAYSKITGSSKGSTEVFLGFGEGSNSGSVDSCRMFTVEIMEKGKKSYIEILATQLTEVLEFGKC